jgi:hypothetical protein
MLKRRLLPTLFTAFLASGCVPYPVYKMLQPEAKVAVHDEQGSPVAAAAVTLVSSAYPYGREKSRETKATGADGIVAFQSRREWRTEVLAIHGREEYFWNWCVQRDGFETFSTNYRGASDFQVEPLVVLKAGQSKPCPQGIR